MGVIMCTDSLIAVLQQTGFEIFADLQTPVSVSLCVFLGSVSKMKTLTGAERRTLVVTFDVEIYEDRDWCRTTETSCYVRR